MHMAQFVFFVAILIEKVRIGLQVSHDNRVHVARITKPILSNNGRRSVKPSASTLVSLEIAVALFPASNKYQHSHVIGAVGRGRPR